jgi:hypothetical protein
MSDELCTAYLALRERIIDDPISGVTVTEEIGAVIGSKDLPRIDVIGNINIRPDDIDAALNNRAMVIFRVNLRIHEDAKEGLTNRNKTRGILWLLQETLNKIYGTDQTAGGAWGMPPKVRGISSTMNETEYTIDLEIQITTARFTRGSL